jgi:hypothetical protein
LPKSAFKFQTRLEDLPNIGKSIAADLRRVGVHSPDQLAKRKSLAIYRKLEMVMGHRHDPCVLYTLISAKHFIEHGEVLPWWKFTQEGKALIESTVKRK